MVSKNKKRLIFLSILIIAITIGMTLALSGRNHSNSKNQDSTFNTLDNNSNHFEIANVWSHDGSSISPSPPTPSEKNTFLPNENIYAVIKTTGIGSMTVRIYIVENEAWKEGASMSDVSSDGYNEVTIDATQNPQYHGPFLIWENPLEIGQYDIVVDEDLDGIRDPGEKVDDSNVAPGVFVVPNLANTLMGLTAFGSAYGLYYLRKSRQ
jgi:hypothetical protein